MGSAYKIPIAVQLLARVEKGEIKLAKRCLTGNGRIRGLLPPNTTVFNKTGTINKVMNDVGIVKLPGDAGHIVVVIFIKDTKLGDDEREKTIAHIARSLYDYFLFWRSA